MKATSNLYLVAVLLSIIMLGMAGCGTPGGSQSRAAAQQQSSKKGVILHFVAESAGAPKPDAGHMIIFKRAQTRFALGDYYHLLRTTDGGRSWQRLLPAPEDEKEFGGKFKEMVVSFFFVTPTRGWMNAARGVWQTEDSGGTWQLIFPNRWKLINFADEQHGWLSLYEGESNIQNYTTRDGGETWQLCGSARDEQIPHTVYFLTPQLGWGVTRRTVDGDEANSVARTTDGGCHWQQLWTSNHNSDERYSTIYFLNEREGWLAGEFNLYRTTDGGSTWKAMLLPSEEAQATDMYFASRKEGWIITALKGEADEVVFHTTNGGRTWRQLTKNEVAGGKLPPEWEAGRLLMTLSATGRR